MNKKKDHIDFSQLLNLNQTNKNLYQLIIQKLIILTSITLLALNTSNEDYNFDSNIIKRSALME